MKNMSDDAFEGRIKNRLSNWEAPSDPRRWISLSGKLSEQRVARMRVTQRWLVAAILLLLLPAGWGGWHFLNSHRSPEYTQLSPASLPELVIITGQNEGSIGDSIDGLIEKEETFSNHQKPIESDGGITNRPKKELAISRANNRVPHEVNLLFGEVVPETTSIGHLTVGDVEIVGEGTGNDRLEGNDYLEIHRLNSSVGELFLKGFLWPDWEIGTIHMDTELDANIKRKEREVLPFELYASAMPLMNFQRVTPNEEDEVFIADLDPLGIGDPNRLGYRLAMGGEIMMNARLSVHAEAAYTYRRGAFNYEYHGTRPDTLIWQHTGDQEFAYIPVFQSKIGGYYYQSHAIGMQVGVGVMLWDFAGPHRLIGGYEAALMVQEEVFDLQGVETPFSRRTPGHLLTIGYRYDRRLSDHWVFRVQPSWRYSLGGNRNISNPLSVAPMSYGVNLGLTYRFKVN